MSKISTETRRELVATIQERYRSASLLDKQRILDEFIALTGYHRKHAIRVLDSGSSIDAEQAATPPRERIYGEAVGEALGMRWEAADRVCGKRLKPLLPTLIAALERHGHLTLDPVVRKRLLTASAATIDRLLTTRRATAGGRRRRPRARSAASRGIPIRTFGDWKEPEPGFLEIDLVAHCGDHVGGSYANTLVLTDLASGWTECVALLVRESALVVDALDRLRASMPFPLRGIDTEHQVRSAPACGRLPQRSGRDRPTEWRRRSSELRLNSRSRPPRVAAALKRGGELPAGPRSDAHGDRPTEWRRRSSG